MMATTNQFFNSSSNNSVNQGGLNGFLRGHIANANITKGAAATKLRKHRINTRGVSNPMFAQNSINLSTQDYKKLNQSNISHDRNSSMQNTVVGAINMNTFTHTDSGAASVIQQANRKPTADSTAYTLYKNGANTKGARAKFSSNGSIDGESPQIAFSDQS
jgi:hypothetical protein